MGAEKEPYTKTLLVPLQDDSLVTGCVTVLQLCTTITVLCHGWGKSTSG